jgi:hypothetical protein
MLASGVDGMSVLPNLKWWLSSVFRKATWLDVRKFISVEMLRDGGSFALKFEGREGNEYMLFTKIRFADVGPPQEDQHGYSQEKEIVGYENPVIIDCDPAKRPQNTTGRIYGDLNGPATRVHWDQARQIVSEAATLAQGLSPIHSDWLKRMTAIVEGDGHPPSGWPTRSTWHKRGPKTMT